MLPGDSESTASGERSVSTCSGSWLEPLRCTYTLYSVIGLPPSCSGGLQCIVALPAPHADAWEITGLPGGVQGVTKVAGILLGPMPYMLIADTERIMADPGGSPWNE
eukprot:768267-Hanusia_phi.AAC.1